MGRHGAKHWPAITRPARVAPRMQSRGPGLARTSPMATRAWTTRGPHPSPVPAPSRDPLVCVIHHRLGAGGQPSVLNPTRWASDLVSRTAAARRRMPPTRVRSSGSLVRCRIAGKSAESMFWGFFSSSSSWASCSSRSFWAVTDRRPGHRKLIPTPVAAVVHGSRADRPGRR